jgi:hypothetical protein
MNEKGMTSFDNTNFYFKNNTENIKLNYSSNTFFDLSSHSFGKFTGIYLF